MYQAGVKKISLIENYGISWRYYDPTDLSKISNLEYTGGVIILENDNRPMFEVKINPSSGIIAYDYSVTFFLYDYASNTIDIIQKLNRSIYGWVMLVEFYDGAYKFYNTPIWFDESSIKPQREMSFEMKMKNRVPTLNRHFEYTPDVSTVTIYRADTTLLTADSTLFTADYGL